MRIATIISNILMILFVLANLKPELQKCAKVGFGFMIVHYLANTILLLRAV